MTDNLSNEALLRLLGTQDARALVAAHEATPPGPHLAKPAAPPAAPGAFETYTADTLYRKEFPAVAETVEGLLTPGLCLLAGAPKRGKSWMALWLALCVASGTPFLLREVQDGTVLYADLESRDARTAGRVQRLVPGIPPTSLHITHTLPALDEGLLAGLDAFADRYTDTRLVIIDTLARIKPASRRGLENAYEADTRLLAPMQAWAMRRGVCLMLVHHLRKEVPGSTDPLERVTGSTGQTGVADTVWLLGGKRGEVESTLSAFGRDIEQAELLLRFDRGLWTVVSADAAAYQAEAAYRGSDVAQAILRFMASGEDAWCGTAAMLRQALGLDDAVSEATIGRQLTIHQAMLQRDGVRVERERLYSGGRVQRVLTLSCQPPA